MEYTEENLDYIMSNDYIRDKVKILRTAYCNLSTEEFILFYDEQMKELDNDGLFYIFQEINEKLNKVLDKISY